MKTFVKSLLVVSVVLFASCDFKKKAQQEEVTVEVLPKIEVETAKRESVVQQISFTGSVEAYAVNNIAPQQARRIERILYDVGDRVKKGALLVQLDKSSLVQAKAQLDNAKVEFERANELYEFGGASKSEWDARRLQYEVAQSAYDNLVENTTLVSPVTGIVSARNYDNGDMSGAQPILVVEQITPVKIMINMSEKYFAYLKKGMKVYVTLDSYGDEQFIGKIARIYPTIDGATRSFPVEITLANTDERVRPGMFARVTLPYGKRNRVVVSDRAINKLMGSGDRYVFIFNPKDSLVRYSKVELGRRLDDRFEIISGVENNEQVVVNGQLSLTNGCKAEVANAQ